MEVTTMNGIRDRIRNIQDRVIEPVEVPEWDMTIYVRSMTAGEKDEWEMRLYADESEGKKKKDLYRALLVILCACDSEGNLLFTEVDREMLSSKSARAIERITDAAMELNKVTKKDEENLSRN